MTFQRTAMPLEPLMHKTIESYRSGSCRNNPQARSHTYAELRNGELYPMCAYGWNRSNGEAYSIFRGSPGTEGACKLCRKNLRAGKPPNTEGGTHKTKWL